MTRSRVLISLGSVTVVALIVATAVLAWSHHRTSSVRAGEAAAERTASDSLVKLFSYTPETVSKDLTSELPLLTGKFRSQYQKAVATSLAPAAAKNQVTTSATIQAVGVEQASATKVTLLAYMNLAVSTVKDTTPKAGGSRVLVTMVKSGGSWRISALEPI